MKPTWRKTALGERQTASMKAGIIFVSLDPARALSLSLSHFTQKQLNKISALIGGVCLGSWKNV